MQRCNNSSSIVYVRYGFLGKENHKIWQRHFTVPDDAKGEFILRFESLTMKKWHDMAVPCDKPSSYVPKLVFLPEQK